MVKRAKRTCRQSGCSDDPYLGGLCRNHHEQDQSRRERRDDALTALRSGVIDGELPSDQALYDELRRLRVWWDRACMVAQGGHDTAVMPENEVDFVVEWCIELGQEIVQAQRAVAKGEIRPLSLSLTSTWVWERLNNLESGLRSNGIRRE